MKISHCEEAEVEEQLIRVLGEGHVGECRSPALLQSRRR